MLDSSRRCRTILDDSLRLLRCVTLGWLHPVECNVARLLGSHLVIIDANGKQK